MSVTYTFSKSNNKINTTASVSAPLFSGISPVTFNKSESAGWIKIVGQKANYLIKPAEDTVILDGNTYAAGSKTVSEMYTLLVNSNTFKAPSAFGNGSIVNAPFGFATLSGGTTGGEGGSTVVVTTGEELYLACTGSTARIIYVSGEILGEGSGAYININPNKTIIGLPGSRLINLPLRIYNSSNVIVRNLRSRDVQQYNIDGDCIGIKNSNNIWIDHCEFSADRWHNDDWEYYDGLVDVTQLSDNVTISYCIFQDTNKASAVGSLAIENTNKNRVTYAFNLFKNCTERSVRGSICVAHMMNNYILNSRSIPTENNGNNGYATMTTEGGIIRLDNNYYSNCNTPIKDNLTNSDPGIFVNIDSNYFDSRCGSNDLTESQGSYDPETLGLYEYKNLLKNVMDVPSYVEQTAGATLKTEIPD